MTDDMFAKNFVVVESSCYFAPYFNIMKVLQSPHTAKNFPFERYLVQGQVRFMYLLYVHSSFALYYTSLLLEFRVVSIIR